MFCVLFVCAGLRVGLLVTSVTQSIRGPAYLFEENAPWLSYFPHIGVLEREMSVFISGLSVVKDEMSCNITFRGVSSSGELNV